MRLVRRVAKPVLYYAMHPDQLFGSGESVVAAANGTRFVCLPQNAIERSILNTGAWEQCETVLVRQLVKAGDVVFDIGANIGYFSFLMAQLVGPGGRVHAFEPTRYALDRFRRNLALNPSLPAASIVLNEVGLLAEPAARFEAIESRFSATLPSYFEREAITFTSLDRYCEEHQLERLDFIKIDVDGYDYEAVKGGGKAIAKYHPLILAEFCQRVLQEKDCDVLRYAQLFLDLGYDRCIVASTFAQTRLSALVRERHFIEDPCNLVLSTQGLSPLQGESWS